MRLTENRTIAWIVFAVVVIAALGLSGNALEKNALELDERAYALDAFYTGSKSFGLTIDSDLKERVKDASALLGVANRYPAVDAAIISAAADARDAMEAANGLAQTEIEARSRANAALDRAIANLFSALTNAPLSESDRGNVRYTYDNFRSHGDTIARADYNKLAADYNAKAKAMYSGFPAYLIGGFKGGAPQLELF